MDKQSALEKLLQAYRRYYTINTDSPLEPFAAQAEFSAHGENYFLVKEAVYAEIDSNEYVYIALEDMPDPARMEMLGSTAWQDGMKKVHPTSTHRNSDVILIVIAVQVPEETARAVRKTEYYRSYRFGLQGWSHYKVIVYELSSGRIFHNRQGKSLKKLMNDIFTSRH